MGEAVRALHGQVSFITAICSRMFVNLHAVMTDTYYGAQSYAFAGYSTRTQNNYTVTFLTMSMEPDEKQLTAL